MKFRFIFIVLITFLLAFSFLYFYGAKIKFLSVFLPHADKKHAQIINTSQKNNISDTFYGINVDMSQLLPASKNYVINNKGEGIIDMSKRLGINLFRITSVSPSFGNSGYIYTKSQWDKVLSKMDKNGIKALILVESPGLHPTDFSKNYLSLVQKYILDPKVLENENVYGVDIRNEPLLSNTNLTAMKKAAEMIKAQYPNTKITVGGWKSINPKGVQNNDPYIWMDAKEGKKLSGFVDFYSVHTYSYDKKFFGVYPDAYNLTLYSLNKILPILSDKPVLIEEFGAGNGDAVTDQQTIGSEKLQANAYDGVYQAVLDLKEQKVIGSVSYLFIKRNEKTDGWAIAKDNGNYLFLSSYVLQKYSLGITDKSLNLPYKQIPNDYLLENKDKGSTINVKVNDIVGLHLKQDTRYVNSLSVSNPSMLMRKEPLTREDNGEYIDAVFHITKSGETEIKIIGRGKGETITRFFVTIKAN